MLQSAEDARRVLEQGQSLFGPGWKHVNSFDDLGEDEDDYEDEEEEEEIYVTLDLGETIDAKALQTETQYQLIGLDTPLPFFKLGNQIFQGQSTPLIGDEVILGLERNHENPHAASHPPLFTTSHRLTFRGITLQPRSQKVKTEHPIPSSGPDGQTARSLTDDISLSQSSPATSSNPNQAGPSDPFGLPRIGGPSATKAKGRPRGSGRSRKILNDPSELETFDFSEMRPHQSVELGPKVIESLGIAAPGDSLVPLTLSKKELERVISDWPSTGSGSRGGKIRSPRNHRDSPSRHASAHVREESGDVNNVGAEVIERSDAPTAPVVTHARGAGDVDVEMRLEEDEDPPWQDVQEGEDTAPP
ncbi:hypothetical protein IAR55_002982 [Kwoniella newhampshirensis]|uniref:Transcription factor TFIIIC triple barrel domain-containing protein n=1 Tax=Kwoniella newhampshirensis TaxID=1651941 RepID=A0AAW0YS89_9TREE